MASLRTPPREQGPEYVRHARADLWIGRLYGRVLPARLRSYLRQSTNPRFRSAVRNLLSAAASWVAARAEPIRTIPLILSRRGADVVVRWKGQSLFAGIVTDLTPVGAKRLNLALIRECLDAYAIPYFLVRGSEAIRFRVGVPAEHREATEKALIELSKTHTFYVQLLQRQSQPRLAGKRAIRKAVGADFFRLTRFQTDPTRCLTLGIGYGCEIEFWDRDGEKLVAPRANPCTEVVSATDPLTSVRESTLSAFSRRDWDDDPVYPSKPGFARPIYSDVAFPIDVVYTWVDGSDPEWQQRRTASAGETYHPQAANSARYISHDELRYSIRSVLMNMPWVRSIYIVTDNQIPDWLATGVPGIQVVDHREIFTDTSALPTFNSHAIETQLHHIDGLSEHFVYLNDDVCIGAPMLPTHFFLASGISRFFPSPALVPLGEPDVEDVPSSVAGKNNRKLIAKEFGVHLSHKMKHVPHALRRSVLFEIEERFSEEHQQTAKNRFRSETDISVTSSLYHYYAFLTGRAIPGGISYAYFDLTSDATPRRLRNLLARRDREVFCLNDTTADSHDGEAQRNILLPFLEAYFPVPSPFELGSLRASTQRSSITGNEGGFFGRGSDHLASKVQH